MEGVASASDQKLEFMTLLVTELQNQNPLEPVDNQQMAAQLAQFSQLEQSEEMNATMSKMNETFRGAMIVAEMDYARSLLDKEVSFYSGYYEQTLSGRVEKMDFVEGRPVLAVNVNTVDSEGNKEVFQFPVKLEEITSVSN